MNPTKFKAIHPIFQNKNTQTEQPSTVSKGGIIQTSDTPYSKKSIPPRKSIDDKERYAKKKAQATMRAALKLWHKNPKYVGSDYKICQQALSQTFPNLPREEF